MARPSQTGPVYLQITATLRDQIKAKRFLAGEYLPSERQLAARFGVTQVTLRRALAVLRDERLIVSERGRGNRVVWSPPPVNRRVNLFFFKWLSPFEDPVLSRLCTSIASACSAMGYKLELSYTKRDSPAARDGYVSWARRHLAEVVADGIVVVGTPEYYGPLINEIEGRFPTVLVGSPGPAQRADIIEPDYEGAMELAVRHANELRGRQLMLLTDVFPEEPEHDRRNIETFQSVGQSLGYSEQQLLLWKAGEEARLANVHNDYHVSPLLIERLRSPATLIATAPSLAVHAMSLVTQMGLRVPRDIAIISTQDDTRLSLINPPITGVDLLGHATGELAVSFLHQRLENPALPRRQERASPTLLIRGSCEEFATAEANRASTNATP